MVSTITDYAVKPCGRTPRCLARLRPHLPGLVRPSAAPAMRPDERLKTSRKTCQISSMVEEVEEGVQLNACTGSTNNGAESCARTARAAPAVAWAEPRAGANPRALRARALRRAFAPTP